MELKIINHSHQLDWNFQDIKTALQSHIEKYCGLVVTEANLKDMESAQKEIASVRVKIEAFRKEVKKRLEEPYKSFEIQVKELQALIEQAEMPLKQQIYKYEEERRTKLEATTKVWIEEIAAEAGLREEYVGQIAVQAQWLNRTAKQPAVKKEIAEIVGQWLERQRQSDEAKQLAEQKKAMIAKLCEVNSFGLLTPIRPEDIAHKTNGASLADITDIIVEACLQRKEMEAKAAAKAAEPAPIVEPIMPEPAPTPPVAEPVSIRQYGPPIMSPITQPPLYTYCVKFINVTQWQADQMKELYQQLGITYEVVNV